MTRVTLLTDFGTADGYAAAMAGVIAAAAPLAIVEHASHDIPPGDVLGAAITLVRYAFLYPPGTVHVVVVDPGVGSTRRAIAATVDGRRFVAPDNGVLTLVLRAARTRALVRIVGPETGVSATFHGRDVFAPAAGRLAAGDSLGELGETVADPVLLDLAEPIPHPGGVTGEVLEVDRFGNLISNIPVTMLQSDPGGAATGVAGEVRIGGRTVGPIRRTYSDVAPGEALALVGSLGLLEVSVRDGSAAERFGCGRGAEVGVSSAASG